MRGDTVAFVMLICLTAAPAFSQTQRANGPFSGLFGAGATPENGQTLDLRGSVFGIRQWLEVPPGPETAVLDPRWQSTKPFAGGSASLDYSYSRRSNSTSLSLGGDGTATAYSTAPRDPLLYGGGDVALNTRLTSRVTFTAAGQARYSSTFNYAQPGSGVAFSQVQGIDFGFLGFNNLTTSADVGLNAQLSQRSSLVVGLQARKQTMFTDIGRDMTMLGSQASYNHRIFRRLSFRAGYRRQQTSFNGVGALPFQSFDFGLNYGDALTLNLSRRTTLSLGVGLGTVRTFQDQAGTRVGQTQLRLLGNATLAHTMGRTWTSSLAYSRTLNYMIGFVDPVLQDGVNANLNGLLSPRVSFTAYAAWTRGYVGLDQPSFSSYWAAATLNAALSRRVSLFVMASTFTNQSTSTFFTTIPMLTPLSRRAVTAGVSFWQPLFTRPRARR